MKNNWGIIILAILIIIVLFFLFRINNAMTIQTRLMIGMAQKLGITQTQREPEPINEETPEESKMILEIAKKMFKEKKLSAKEKRFRKKFEEEINEEVELLSEKTGTDNKTSPETDTAETPKEEKKDNTVEPPAVQNKKSEEQKKNKIKIKIKREETLLSLFEDGIPKISNTLIQLFADKRGTKPNGSINRIMTKLVKKGKLKKHNDYYCLTQWFDDNKLKKEYKEKIN